jgi:hypothetical protein
MISDNPCLEPLTDVKFWAQPWPGPRGAEQSRPFNPTSEAEEKAKMEHAQGNARLDPDDE